jgi:octaprenyl-diphosphate synthase
MREAGSMAYAAARAAAFVAAANRELEIFEDSSAKRALSIVADYMIHRDR